MKINSERYIVGNKIYLSNSWHRKYYIRCVLINSFAGLLNKINSL